MFEKALREEFDYWLGNVEWTDEQKKILDKLDKTDKNKIINKVINDEEFTQEMFNTFEWWLNRYIQTSTNEKWVE